MSQLANLITVIEPASRQSNRSKKEVVRIPVPKSVKSLAKDLKRVAKLLISSRPTTEYPCLVDQCCL